MSLDENQRFAVLSITREYISDVLNLTIEDLTSSNKIPPLAPNDDRLTTDICQQWAMIERELHEDDLDEEERNAQRESTAIKFIEQHFMGK